MAIISMVFTGPCQMLQDVDDDDGDGDDGDGDDKQGFNKSSPEAQCRSGQMTRKLANVIRSDT